jgi:hypothetical protein
VSLSLRRKRGSAIKTRAVYRVCDSFARLGAVNGANREKNLPAGL